MGISQLKEHIGKSKNQGLTGNREYGKYYGRQEFMKDRSYSFEEASLTVCLQRKKNTPGYMQQVTQYVAFMVA